MNFREGSEISFFISDKEIDEVSILGFYKLIERKMNLYKGLDVYAYIGKGYYDRENDFLSVKSEYIPNIKNVKSKLKEHQKNLLNDCKDIFCVYFVSEPRYNKSAIWKLLNKRKNKIFYSL